MPHSLTAVRASGPGPPDQLQSCAPAASHAHPPHAHPPLLSLHCCLTGVPGQEACTACSDQRPLTRRWRRPRRAWQQPPALQARRRRRSGLPRPLHALHSRCWRSRRHCSRWVVAAGVLTACMVLGSHAWCCLHEGQCCRCDTVAACQQQLASSSAALYSFSGGHPQHSWLHASLASCC